ncbi:hypothetical protein EYF80_025220 [Liparis tanakae]|uniref:Uncharacterized protein n=1 Tax=Liparis tanakae TaxID=230148 RepID=A0A4Z2HI20_9TELE|nr:hypothetical protein EYF80_025220 [Liparis tanakae]
MEGKKGRKKAIRCRYLFWVVHHQSVLVLSCVCHPTCNTKAFIRELNISGLQVKAASQVALHGGQHLPQLVPAPHCVQVLAQHPQDKVFSAGLHGGNLGPAVPPGVVSTSGPHGTRPPGGVLHLPAHDKQEIPHHGHAVVAAAGGHGRQLAPVGPARNAHVLLRGRVEVAQLPHPTDLPLPPAGDVEGEGLEARPGAGRLAKGLGKGTVVVVQGLLHQGGGSRAGPDQRVAPGEVVQRGDVHQAVANVLEQVIGVLVPAVVVQPQNDQLWADEVEKN